MKKYQKEIIKLTAKEILLTFFDLALPFLDAGVRRPSKEYCRSMGRYKDMRSAERSEFLGKIRYLRRQGYIQTFVENKKRFVELTAKGFKKIQETKIENIKISKPKKWDGKWRVIIFDVREKIRYSRDIFRDKLRNLGFIQIQKSVYVYPFECAAEIKEISRRLGIEQYVLIMISEIIQGEEKIIEGFIEKEILGNKDLKIRK